ncbi:hypothetical protein QWY31_02415 [Cytophagales bacterium LB-30]|uniref:DUF2970 domain-containing protein n=1 Tax=Shiella aurantiaca TaxID=3058365 RepID=A0ABT8F1M8_9BACT|nr:hypothetical protein [Shiella aurantiaca]MDN4164335.1 hypothetical protein [Shiella aurantiaca]
MNLQGIIEKFYAKVFEDPETKDTEPVPYANKRFMFWFSLVLFAVVLALIIKDIIHNIQSQQTP